MIKGVIFDLGGVVLDWKDDTIYRYIAERFNLDFKLTRKTLEELVKLVDTGEMSEKVMWTKFFAENNIPLPTDHENLWRKKFEEESRINPEVLVIVKKLKAAGYKVAMLSNNEPSHIDIDRERGTFEHFDPVVLSCEVGIRKPDERIYRLTLQRMKLKPEETVFIDNRLENVEGARAVGIHGILFEDAEQLKKELKRSGVNGI